METKGVPVANQDEAPGVQVNSEETVAVIPVGGTLRELQETNERYWVQSGGEFFPNDGKS